MSSFYVAAKAPDSTGNVSRIVEAMKQKGYTPAFDWTDTIVDKPYTSERNLETNSDTAARMIKAVQDSDWLILIDAPNVYGATLETGVALGSGTSVVVVGSCRESIFWAIPQVALVDTVVEAMNLIPDKN